MGAVIVIGTPNSYTMCEFGALPMMRKRLLGVKEQAETRPPRAGTTQTEQKRPIPSPG
jgi:hypothetical protein